MTHRLLGYELPVALAGATDLASEVVRLKRLRRPVPVWMVLVGILVTASVAAAIFVGPTYLGPKPDFTLNPVQFSNSVIAGPSPSGEILFRIRVTSVNGFSGIVSFSATAPASLNVRLNGIGSPNPVAILGRNDTIEAFVGARSVGNHTLTVRGTYGALSHSVTLMVIAQSISSSANPDPIVVSKTASKNSTITLTGVNGFSGNVDLSLDSSYFFQVHPFNVFLPFHGTASVIATTSLAAGDPCPPGTVIYFIAMTNEGDVIHDFNMVCS